MEDSKMKSAIQALTFWSFVLGMTVTYALMTTVKLKIDKNA